MNRHMGQSLEEILDAALRAALLSSGFPERYLDGAVDMLRGDVDRLAARKQGPFVHSEAVYAEVRIPDLMLDDSFRHRVLWCIADEGDIGIQRATAWLPSS